MNKWVLTSLIFLFSLTGYGTVIVVQNPPPPGPVQAVVVQPNGTMVETTFIYNPSAGGIVVPDQYAGEQASIFFTYLGLRYLFWHGYWVDHRGGYWVHGNYVHVTNVHTWNNHWNNYWDHDWHNKWNHYHNTHKNDPHFKYKDHPEWKSHHYQYHDHEQLHQRYQQHRH